MPCAHSDECPDSICAVLRQPLVSTGQAPSDELTGPHFFLLPFRIRHTQRTCVSSAAPGFHHLFFMVLTLNQLEQMKAIISELVHHHADLLFLGGTLTELGFYHFCHGRPGSSERKCFEVLDNFHYANA